MPHKFLTPEQFESAIKEAILECNGVLDNADAPVDGRLMYDIKSGIIVGNPELTNYTELLSSVPESRLRDELKLCISKDGRSLFQGGWFLGWNCKDDEAVLDGQFSATDLIEIGLWMLRNKEPE